MRKRIEVSFYKNHFESRAKKEQNHSQTSCGRRKSGFYSEISYKRREVTKSPRTLNPMRKKVKVLIHEEFQTSCRRRKKYQSSQLLRISGGRELELQSSSKKIKPCTEQGQNIRYHCCGKFRMSQVTHFKVDLVYLPILE